MNHEDGRRENNHIGSSPQTRGIDYGTTLGHVGVRFIPTCVRNRTRLTLTRLLGLKGAKAEIPAR
jgi:hypothetical protein